MLQTGDRQDATDNAAKVVEFFQISRELHLAGHTG